MRVEPCLKCGEVRTYSHETMRAAVDWRDKELKDARELIGYLRDYYGDQWESVEPTKLQVLEDRVCELLAEF